MNRKAWFTGLVGLALVAALSFGIRLTAAGTASPAVGPNIVVVLTDDQSMTMLEAMPYLSSRPHGSWVTFPNAFVHVPLCCPSRATILSGQYAHHHGINNSNGAGFDDSATIATWLDDAGYRTGIVGKYLNGYPFRNKPENYIAPGWDYWAVFSSVDHYDYRLNENGEIVSYGSEPEDYSTDVLYRKAIDFIEGTDPDQPFLLYFSTHAPHAVNTPAPRHEGRYAELPVEPSPNLNEADVSDKPAWVRALPLRPQRDFAAERRDAAETLLAVDEAIEGIVDAVSRRGQLDDTVIVFMTDNGFSFGSHRWVQKSCVYEECVRTPLLVRYPGAGGNREDPRLVSNVDIAPTLAEIARTGPDRTIDGRSLVPLLTGESTTWRNSVLLRYGESGSDGGPPQFWAVRTDRWKYVEIATGERELYDLAEDPYELVNIVEDPAHASVVRDLAAELERLRAG